MAFLYESSDILRNPYECFCYSSNFDYFPVQPHCHYFMEVLFITKGVALVQCDDHNYVVRENEIILFPPSSVHSIASEDENYLEYYVLKFDLNQLNSAVTSSDLGNINFFALFTDGVRQKHPDIHIKPPTVNPVGFYDINTLYDYSTERFRAMFELAIRETNEKKYGYQTTIRSVLCFLLISILRIWRNKGFDTDFSYSTLSKDNDIYNITEYIDHHLQDELHVEDLASLCHMSYSYFAKTFREIYGQSCKRYISFLRLCKVENMLLFTNHDLNYISQETGFSDCSHLIHVFKEKYGVTPHQYRKDRRSSTTKFPAI